MSLYNSERKKINDLNQEQEAIKQRIAKLQEEYNRWYALFGNDKYNSINQSDEQ
jgi:hypothetical protein